MKQIIACGIDRYFGGIIGGILRIVASKKDAVVFEEKDIPGRMSCPTQEYSIEEAISVLEMEGFTKIKRLVV